MEALTTTPPSIREELADISLSFVEVAIHCLLFYRGLYPPSVFEKRKEYGLAVWMSRHPALNASIADALAAAKRFVMANAVESVLLVITDNGGRAIEQYSFDLAVNLERDVPATYSDVETVLGDALTKIALLEGSLPPLGKDCAFTIMLAAHETLEGPRWSGNGSAGSSSSIADSVSKWSRVGLGDPEASLFAKLRRSPDGADEASGSIDKFSTSAPGLSAAHPEGGGAYPHSASGVGASSASSSSSPQIAPRAQSMVLKCIRVGVLSIDVKLQRMDWG